MKGQLPGEYIFVATADKLPKQFRELLMDERLVTHTS